MTRIQTTAVIAVPVSTLYNYVTTPGYWPQWHPSSLAVHGNAQHSLQVGESVKEDYNVAGRTGQVVWTVTARDEPVLWAIEGLIVGYETGGTITYRLTPQGRSTHFVRTFDYPTPGLSFTLLDWLFLRRQIKAESAEAVHRLQAILQAAS